MSFYSDFAEMINTTLDIYRTTETLGPMNRPSKDQDFIGTLTGYFEYKNGSIMNSVPMKDIKSDAIIFTGPEVDVNVGDILKDSNKSFEVVFVNDMLLNDHIEIDVVFKGEL